MNLNVVAVIGIAAMLLFVFLGMTIGLSTFLVGVAGCAYVVHGAAALGVLQAVPISSAMTYSFCVMPMFILMGLFCFRSGISTDLFNAAHKWFGGVKGGLAMASVVTCAAFGAICGSLPATVATMTTTILPEMRKRGYEKTLSSSSLAGGGTLGVLIPPSTPFIMYGIVAEQSIGRLFASGVGPGLLMIVLFCAVIAIRVRLHPEYAPEREYFSWREKIASLKNCLSTFVMFILVIGGMFIGAFSATEAAAIGALLSFLILMARKRSCLKETIKALFETLETAGMSLMIMIGAYVFGYFLTITQLPQNLAMAITGMSLNKYIILIGILLVFAILGCVMDSLALIVLLVPIFLPIVEGVGFDAIWFGAIMVLVANLGALTPPVGICLYIVSGIADDISLSDVIRGIFPMCLAILLCIALCTVFPQICTWLPSLVVD